MHAIIRWAACVREAKDIEPHEQNVKRRPHCQVGSHNSRCCIYRPSWNHTVANVTAVLVQGHKQRFDKCSKIC